MTTTTTKQKVNGVLVPDSAGGQAYRRVLGEEGADPTTANQVMFTPFDLGYEPTLFVNASRTLTLADRLSTLASSSSGSVVMLLPLFYTLGYTRVAGTTSDIVLTVGRQYTGATFVTPSQYRGEVASQAAMLALSTAVQGDWCQRTDLNGAGSRGGQVAVLTGTTFSTLAHWTILPHATANRPNIAWGAVANLAGRTGLSNAIIGDFCTQTDAGAATYQLAIAGPSTDANWVLRTDADKPVDPSIKIYDPLGLTVANSASMMAPESQYVTCGFGNDIWRVR